MSAAAILIALAGWWLVIGAGVATLFLIFGIDRIDEDARGAYVFRPLLIPGILLIWPLVLWRWLRLESQTDRWMARYEPLRAAHLPAAVLLCGAVGFALIAGIAVRQTWPTDVAPENLSEAQQ